MRTILLTFLFVLTVSPSWSEDVPAGASVVYVGTYDPTYYDCVYYRTSDGVYWRRIILRSDESLATETRYTNLDAFRNALLTVDDRAGVMESSLWRRDSDGDGYSDMLEYLTNGDPYDAGKVPTEPRILSFDNGTTYEPLLPVKDMAAGNGPESAESEEIVLLERIESLLHLIGTLLSFGIGLVLWRLVILSKSQRNLL